MSAHDKPAEGKDDARPLDLDAIKQRWVGVAPKCWRALPVASGTGAIVRSDGGREVAYVPKLSEAIAIASAREDVDGLVAEVERLRACFEAMRDHRDALRVLNTYRETPSHMRGPGYDSAQKKLTDAYLRLRALGVEP